MQIQCTTAIQYDKKQFKFCGIIVLLC